jgi:inosine-uridine nucleoside N-ribohydrolase
MKRIIIDTDPGHDDALALMLACKSPELEVLAVTTVCGNSTIENTTRNARYILEFIGKQATPIYSGATKPLARDLIQAVVHGKSGLEGIDPTNAANLTNNAAAKIAELAQANPDKITLVTLGPLTNIAQAIQKYPRAMRQLREIIAMGGAIEVPGNKNRVAEFNMFVDPEAAEIVLNAGIAITLVPLDPCNSIGLQLGDIDQIPNERMRSLLRRMLTPYISNLTKDTGVKMALMYDPLTVFYLLNPRACKTKQYNVQIETKGTITRGMTVTDRRLVTDGARPNANVVTDINATAFVKTFIETVGRG